MLIKEVKIIHLKVFPYVFLYYELSNLIFMPLQTSSNLD